LKFPVCDDIVSNEPNGKNKLNNPRLNADAGKPLIKIFF
jgi:hypothetical protein